MLRCSPLPAVALVLTLSFTGCAAPQPAPWPAAAPATTTRTPSPAGTPAPSSTVTPSVRHTPDPADLAKPGTPGLQAWVQTHYGDQGYLWPISAGPSRSTTVGLLWKDPTPGQRAAVAAESRRRHVEGVVVDWPYTLAEYDGVARRLMAHAGELVNDPQARISVHVGDLPDDNSTPPIQVGIDRPRPLDAGELDALARGLQSDVDPRVRVEAINEQTAPA